MIKEGDYIVCSPCDWDYGWDTDSETISGVVYQIAITTTGQQRPYICCSHPAFDKPTHWWVEPEDIIRVVSGQSPLRDRVSLFLLEGVSI